MNSARVLVGSVASLAVHAAMSLSTPAFFM